MADERQEVLDRFYHSRGPCCAGCDWWHHFSSLAGECRRHAPHPEPEVHSSLVFDGSALSSGGHTITRRDHHCGDFKDEFDWASLPLPYRRSVGAPL